MALPQLLNRLEEVVPSGFIGMWSGSANTIPTGWALCDGANGTPNLTDRFVLGAGKAYQPGATGGTATATPSVAAGNAKTGVSLSTAAPGGTAGKATTGIGVQNAALSIWTGAAGTGIGIQGTTLDGNTLPNHGHTYSGGSQTTRVSLDQATIKTVSESARNTGATGNSWAHAHGVSDPGHAHAVGSSEHSHGITDSGHTHTLTAQAISTMSPYYALCLIIKL